MSDVTMPRPRYVAVRIDGAAPAPRRAFSGALRAAAQAAAWPDAAQPHLTRYAWPHAIVRVEHTQVAAVRALLESVRTLDGRPVRVACLSTSGTLKALTERLGILRTRTD